MNDGVLEFAIFAYFLDHHESLDDSDVFWPSELLNLFLKHVLQFGTTWSVNIIFSLLVRIDSL
jgi:hypothetical protein